MTPSKKSPHALTSGAFLRENRLFSVEAAHLHITNPTTVRRPIGPPTKCCWCHLPNHKGTDMHQHCRRVVRAGIERAKRRVRKAAAGVGAGE
jgi:hypothetical protein